MASILNRDLLPGNVCFGCGLDNPAGLHIEVVRDAENAERLRATFTPTERMIGFPGIAHGGAIFTALDCLSTWVATLLGPNRSAAWVLRSAQTVFHKPASAGRPLSLSGSVQERGGAWEPATIRVEARDEQGALCVEGAFKVVPLSKEKFKSIAGVDDLPDGWKTFLAGGE